MLRVSCLPARLQRPSWFPTVTASVRLNIPRRVCSAAFPGVVKVRPSIDTHRASGPGLSAFVPLSARTEDAFHLRRFDDLDGLLRAISCASEEAPPILRFTASSIRSGSFSTVDTVAAYTASSASRLQRMFLLDGPQRCEPFRAFPSPVAPRPSLVAVPFPSLEFCPCVAFLAEVCSVRAALVDLKGLSEWESPLPARSVSPQSARPDALLSFSLPALRQTVETDFKEACSGAVALE